MIRLVEGRLRWVPEQFRHTNIPSVYEAQSGSSNNKSQTNKHVNNPVKLPQSEKTGHAKQL